MSIGLDQAMQPDFNLFLCHQGSGWGV